MNIWFMSSFARPDKTHEPRIRLKDCKLIKITGKTYKSRLAGVCRDSEAQQVSFVGPKFADAFK